MRVFLSLPTSVKFAIVFLTILIISGVILFPHIVVPLILILGGVFSVMRILIYLFHKV